MAKPSKPTRPKKLCKGDTVGVVAPAGVVERESLEKGLRVLEKMGFHPRLGNSVLARRRYMAGDDEDRAGDLMAMFADPEVKAIICARGGYGANRILPFLKPSVIRKNPKIFVGSSDATVLLLYLLQKCSLVAFHGPMVAGSFGRAPMTQSRKQFFNLLSGLDEAKRLTAKKARALNPGKAKGIIVGGCLTLLCRSLKTSWEIETRNRIVLIEDVNEAPYRIDGMLWQLKEAGKFKNVRGVAFGEMVNCRPPRGARWTLDDVLADVFKDEDFPILTHLPIGHGKEIWTTPLGTPAVLDADDKSLTLENCGVV